MRGRGLPACANGVTVPTSTCCRSPSLRRRRCSGRSCRGRPRGRRGSGKRKPGKKSPDRLTRSWRKAAASGVPCDGGRAPARVSSWARSASMPNRNGRARGYGNNGMSGWRLWQSGPQLAAYCRDDRDRLPSEQRLEREHLRRDRRCRRAHLWGAQTQTRVRCTISTSRRRRCRAELLRCAGARSSAAPRRRSNGASWARLDAAKADAIVRRRRRSPRLERHDAEFPLSRSGRPARARRAT